MIFRTAELKDIQQMQIVRHLVKENTLSDPALVTDSDVAYYLTIKGKGWVCEDQRQVVGFSIVDVKDNCVWALFVNPEFAQKGIGKQLHRLMLDWYFTETATAIVLGTAPNTRAERFYSLQGWRHIGNYPNGEIKLEMTKESWLRQRDFLTLWPSSDKNY
ncbi:GNAT family N-acetyltransferase [Mucilaginibacter ginkgonis]|uniref:GNAT family N-acetyltransferase n=1 Tax=Mucilaginibacter ginkgonis TaxID=2682091 RepID=A0A6I4IP06_9SPHI|nr:GNAT family N-acetyltransferase [Mucilaginibacter ginkgonis]QQL50900.1 GNAT family N-acetyltransferase [Mucilaginibacter ginkgonis]